MSHWFEGTGPYTAAELAKALNCKAIGAADRILSAVKPLDMATNADVSFLDNPKYKNLAELTKAAAVIVSEENKHLLPKDCVAIVTSQPYVAFAKALQLFYPSGANRWATGKVHKTAVVEKSAKVAKTASVGANSYIGENVIIGENVSIAPNVTIVNTHIDDYTVVHPGVCIGQDGFGFAYDSQEKKLEKVPQVGGVRIGRFVEIGANSTIDCGALEDTVIGDMTKIDNLVQIGHNVKIGRMCQIVSQTGIAGSAVLGDGVVIGGQSGVAGHLKVADGVMLAARSGISKSIETKGETLAGFPAIPIKDWRRAQVKLARLLKK